MIKHLPFLIFLVVLLGCTVITNNSSIVKLKAVDNVSEDSLINATAELQLILKKYPQFKINEIMSQKEYKEIWIWTYSKDVHQLNEFLEPLIGKKHIEGKIGNNIVINSFNDIKFICREQGCTKPEKYSPEDVEKCVQVEGQWKCPFFFTIEISDEASERLAAITNNLTTIETNGSSYLEDVLEIFINDNKIDTLRIGSDLKGQPTKYITISGSGTGKSYQDAYLDSYNKMLREQNSLSNFPLELKFTQ